MSRLDLIIFGASGFTGKYAIKQLIRITKEKGLDLTWGIAGRNKDKLLTALNDVAKKEGKDVSKIPVIVADLNNYDSIVEMAKQTKVIVNCCGPYRFYGETVVKACIESKTHQVDVSGEPGYMEKMQLLYHEKAKENEVYIISACGVESIPADLGIVFLKDNFKGEVNSVEMFMDTWTTGNISGSGVHYGTWESAVHSIGSWSELFSLRKKLFPLPLPPKKPKLQRRFPISKNNILNKWCLPFPGPDKSVVKRSQYYFYEHEKERPIQVESYIAFPNLLTSLTVILTCMIFGIMASFRLGRSLLLKYPKIFSLGFASHEGPPEDQAEKTYFALTLCAEGWKDKLADPNDVHVEPPNKKMAFRISGRNPGYGATCTFLIVSALTILGERDRMPNRGGIYPPGAAFSKTSMIKQLSELDITFQILPEKN